MTRLKIGFLEKPNYDTHIYRQGYITDFTYQGKWQQSRWSSRGGDATFVFDGNTSGTYAYGQSNAIEFSGNYYVTYDTSYPCINFDRDLIWFGNTSPGVNEVNKYVINIEGVLLIKQ